MSVNDKFSLPPGRQESAQLSIYHELDITMENRIFVAH